MPINEPTADLHLHTTHSDGSLTPDEVIQESLRRGLSLISITDHHVISGCLAAKETLAGDKSSSDQLNILIGIEISTRTPVDWPAPFADKGCDILGYGFDPDNNGINRITQHALANAMQIIQPTLRAVNGFLANCSLPLRVEQSDLETVSPNGNYDIGHVGRILRTKVKKLTQEEKAIYSEMLLRYLGYIPETPKQLIRSCLRLSGETLPIRQLISPTEAIEIIMNARGRAVLAHPGSLTEGEVLTEEEMTNIEYVIKMLKDYGLSGVEVVTPKHNSINTDFFLKTAKRHNLIPTGGSDDHGRGRVGNLNNLLTVTYKSIELLLG